MCLSCANSDPEVDCILQSQKRHREFHDACAHWFKTQLDLILMAVTPFFLSQVDKAVHMAQVGHGCQSTCGQVPVHPRFRSW